MLQLTKSAIDPTTGETLAENGSPVYLRASDISGHGTGRFGREIYLFGGQTIYVQESTETLCHFLAKHNW